jgi:hypothetical protein
MQVPNLPGDVHRGAVERGGRPHVAARCESVCADQKGLQVTAVERQGVADGRIHCHCIVKSLARDRKRDKNCRIGLATLHDGLEVAAGARCVPGVESGLSGRKFSVPVNKETRPYAIC